jgi:hypothetical protein
MSALAPTPEELLNTGNRNAGPVSDDTGGIPGFTLPLEETNRSIEVEPTDSPGTESPKNPLIPYSLACYYCQVGNITQALRWLKEAFALAGNSRKIRAMALDEADLLPLWAAIAAL